MSKGGDYLPRKKNVPEVATLPEGSEGQSGSTPPPPLPEPLCLRIFIVFYSMYSRVESLSRWMKHGVDGVAGVKSVLYHVEEILMPEVLEKMKSPPKGNDVPVISMEELARADEFLLDFPTRSLLWEDGCWGTREWWSGVMFPEVDDGWWK